MSTDKWSDNELLETVKAYMLMLKSERDGQTYSKTDFRNQLLNGPLSSRTKGSVELRMQNISAFREEKGLDWIYGYKPMSHIGEGVKARIGEIFEKYNEELSTDIERSNTENTKDLASVATRGNSGTKSNKIRLDFETLITRTKEALLSADLRSVEGLGIGGHFPYMGPAHSFAREGSTSPLIGKENYPIYNPIKGYTRGLFLHNYSLSTGRIDNDLLPLQDVGEFYPVDGNHMGAESNSLSISCEVCESHLKLPTMWNSFCEWGNVTTFAGDLVVVKGYITLELRQFSCDGGHLRWGFTTISTFTEKLP